MPHLNLFCQPRPASRRKNSTAHAGLGPPLAVPMAFEQRAACGVKSEKQTLPLIWEKPPLVRLDYFSPFNEAIPDRRLFSAFPLLRLLCPSLAYALFLTSTFTSLLQHPNRQHDYLHCKSSCCAHTLLLLWLFTTLARHAEPRNLGYLQRSRVDLGLLRPEGGRWRCLRGRCEDDHHWCRHRRYVFFPRQSFQQLDRPCCWASSLNSFLTPPSIQTLVPTLPLRRPMRVPTTTRRRSSTLSTPSA